MFFVIICSSCIHLMVLWSPTTGADLPFRPVTGGPSSGGWLHDAEEIRASRGHRVEETGIAVLDESAVHAVDAVTVADPIEVLWNEVLVCGRDVDGGSAADQRLEILLLVLFHM